jgi:hypothetical protein
VAQSTPNDTNGVLSFQTTESGDLGKACFQYYGVIDDVRISRSVRYVKDFVPKRNWPPDANTLVQYNCDEYSGSVLRDNSGNGNHAMLFNARRRKVDVKAPIDAGLK